MNNEPQVIEAEPPELSEDALADKFTSLHKNSLRYTAALGKYHRLSETAPSGSVWKPDTQLSTLSDIRKLVRAEATGAAPAKQIKLCSTATVYAVEKLAKTDQRTAMRVEQWDSNTMLLNTPSGLIDL